MYLATLSKNPHVNSDQFMTCASMSGSTMSRLVGPMTRDHLDTNIIAHDRNLIRTISS